MTKAFVPGNVSCIFRICRDKNPAKMHSLGVGFTVDKGAVVIAKKTKKTIIKLNNKKTKFPTVLSVIKKLSKQPLEINIKLQLPLGVGFGMSGASALATSYAVGKLLKLKKNKKQLALIAHIAEVENRTGLGDVNGQFNGGFLIKTKRNSPLKAQRLRIKNRPIYYRIFGKIDTKKVITNRKKEKNINKAADKALEKIKNKKNLNDIIDISKEFAIKSNLMNKKLLNIINKIEKNNGKASMIMLGNAIFSNIPFKNCKNVKISYNKARLLWHTSLIHIQEHSH